MVSQPGMEGPVPTAPIDDRSAGRLAGRLAGRRFARMNGIGNAILVLDGRGLDAPVTGAEARALAAVPALAFDQLMVVHDAREPGTDAFLAILNRDGSSSAACGNGTRCVAHFLLRDTGRDALVLATAATRLACRRLGASRFSVDMGPPSFDPAAIPVRAQGSKDGGPASVALPGSPFGPAYAVGMGNPHAVFFLPGSADLDALDLARVGPPVEHAPAFPAGVNVSFAQVLDPARIRLRVWERGAGATLGCGSGACATLVAAAATGRAARAATVELPGGSLDIEWRADDHVVMTGPVELEMDGTLGAPRAAEAA